MMVVLLQIMMLILKALLPGLSWWIVFWPIEVALLFWALWFGSLVLIGLAVVVSRR